MQIKIFTIPALAAKDPTDELNTFLRSNRVLEIKKEFVNGDNGAFWAICVTYLPAVASSPTPALGGRKEKVDYRQVLPEEEFVRFCELRKIRKKQAEDDGVPPFAVFTDAELAEIARMNPPTPSGMKKITGIGEKKVARYGAEMCRIYQENINIAGNEKGGQPDGEDM